MIAILAENQVLDKSFRRAELASGPPGYNYADVHLCICPGDTAASDGWDTMPDGDAGTIPWLRLRNIDTQHRNMVTGEIEVEYRQAL